MSLLSLVARKVSKAYQACGYEKAPALTDFSDRPDISDYQSNGALQLAKTEKKNPREIALKIADVLKRDSFFAHVSVDGPGFINMRLSNEALTTSFYLFKKGKNGYVRSGKPKRIVIDYGGPNVAKALHVGHLRPAVIGEAVKRIHQYAGDDIIGDIHLGDWGLPIGLLIAEIEERYPDLPFFSENYRTNGEKLPFTEKDLEEMYPAASQKSKADEFYLARAKENTRLLQNGHKGYRALWRQILRLSVREIKKTYRKLDVHFDLWLGESSVNVRLKKMIKRLQKQKILIHDAGAEVIRLKSGRAKAKLPPLIMVKSDGAVMYCATDLATIEQRMEDFHPDRILYVVDARQALHFEQVFSAARQIGLAGRHTDLLHLGFGTITGADNKPFKTRDGGVMTLERLLKEAEEASLKKVLQSKNAARLSERKKAVIARKIAVSAVKFTDLMNERMRNYVFDIDKMTALEGKTAPYILYALVRMKSVLAKMPDARLYRGLKMTLTEPAERVLLMRLYQMPEFFQTAYQDEAPHVICDYLYKLTQDFNVFYHDCPIRDAHDRSVRFTRFLLTATAYRIAFDMARIIGLEVPEIM